MSGVIPVQMGERWNEGRGDSSDEEVQLTPESGMEKTVGPDFLSPLRDILRRRTRTNRRRIKSTNNYDGISGQISIYRFP